MEFKKLRPVFELLIWAIPTYALHELAFFAFGIDQVTFAKPIFSAYAFFTGFSVLSFMTLVIVKEKSFDNVGMVFLIFTTAMLGTAFFIFSPILKSVEATAEFEKFNFLGIFGFFMVLDTVIAIRMLKHKSN
jgi:hypothetical protein